MFINIKEDVWDRLIVLFRFNILMFFILKFIKWVGLRFVYKCIGEWNCLVNGYMILDVLLLNFCYNYKKSAF